MQTKCVGYGQIGSFRDLKTKDGKVFKSVIAIQVFGFQIEVEASDAAMAAALKVGDTGTFECLMSGGYNGRIDFRLVKWTKG